MQIVKHDSQEIGLQWRIFVDFFSNPDRLSSQISELIARNIALRVS